MPGKAAKVRVSEIEYTRHGTNTLTAGLDVVTGPIVSPTLEATRTEPEFVEHIARTVSVDPTGEWVFIVDNLDTLASESLVEWVAEPAAYRILQGKNRSRHHRIDNDTARVSLQTLQGGRPVGKSQRDNFSTRFGSSSLTKSTSSASTLPSGWKTEVVWSGR